jgi:hypothetical protein
MYAREEYVGYNGKFHNLSFYTKTSVSNQFFNSLALVSYLRKTHNKSYRGFLELNRETILTSIAQLPYKALDDLWTDNFLKEAKEVLGNKDDFRALKEKVRFFLFCKGRVTPSWVFPGSGELLGF